MNAHHFPIRHGNWRVINGELVDLDQQPEEPLADASPAVPPIPDAHEYNEE